MRTFARWGSGRFECGASSGVRYDCRVREPHTRRVAPGILPACAEPPCPGAREGARDQAPGTRRIGRLPHRSRVGLSAPCPGNHQGARRRDCLGTRPATSGAGAAVRRVVHRLQEDGRHGGAVRAGLAAQHRNLDFSGEDIKSGDPLNDLLAGRRDLAFVSLLEVDLPPMGARPSRS